MEHDLTKSEKLPAESTGYYKFCCFLLLVLTWLVESSSLTSKNNSFADDLVRSVLTPGVSRSTYRVLYMSIAALAFVWEYRLFASRCLVQT